MLASESGEDGFMDSIFVLCQWFSALSVNVNCSCFGLFLRLLFWNGLRQTLTPLTKFEHRIGSKVASVKRGFEAILQLEQSKQNNCGERGDGLASWNQFLCLRGVFCWITMSVVFVSGCFCSCLG
jgi:hypothetical protein